MDAVDQLIRVFWVLNISVQLGLLFLLIVRKEVTRFPAFTAYLVVNLVQSAIFVFVFPRIGATSKAAWRVGWISQGLVVVARSVAVAEVCRGILARYRGIWAMGWRLLATVGIVVLVIAVALGRHDLRAAIITLNTGTELAIAAVMAFLFVFARYYEVPLDDPMRTMGVAFCFLSCASVINDLFLQRFWADYLRFWNLTGTGTFLFVLLLWTWALREPVRRRSTQPALLDSTVYGVMIPEMNKRLAKLNEELATFWRLGSPHT